MEKEDKSLPYDKYKEKYFQAYKQDFTEIGKFQMKSVEWPSPASKYYLVLERVNQSLEPLYFWCLHHFTDDLGFPLVDKIQDTFSASENSSVYGASAQRLGLAQDKVMQFLRVIHDMFRGLVLLVRDVRIIKQKLSYFEDTKKTGDIGDSAEVALKDQFIMLAEGGPKNVSSVLGLAQEARFTTLPDLFFKMRQNPGESENDFYARVNDLPYNETLKTVLKRKFQDYYKWKKHIYDELETRRKFTLKYIRQQYNTINLYLNWTKPYLKHAKRLSISSASLDRPELISAFETSMIEIEILAKSRPQGVKNAYSCVLMNFEFTTKPSMTYQAEPYHRGPSHIGRIQITWRSYGWDEEDIENYKTLREKETLNLLGDIDGSIKDALDAMGDELYDYLKEADEEIQRDKKEAKKEKPQVPGIFEPFSALFSGFTELAKSVSPQKKEERKDTKADKESAKDIAKKMMWVHYKNFKKRHGLITW